MVERLPVKEMVVGSSPTAGANEMVSKLISAAISLFRLRLRQASQKDFHRSSTAPQAFLLACLVSPEKLKFRHERVLKPSQYKLTKSHLITSLQT